MILLMILQFKNKELNYKLVEFLENFEFYENIYRKKIGDKINFQLVTIVFQIKQNQYIPKNSL